MLKLAAPYAEIFLGATTLRASNAKARRELGWAPAVQTYRVGITRSAQVLGRSA